MQTPCAMEGTSAHAALSRVVQASQDEIKFNHFFTSCERMIPGLFRKAGKKEKKPGDLAGLLCYENSRGRFDEQELMKYLSQQPPHIAYFLLQRLWFLTRPSIRMWTIYQTRLRVFVSSHNCFINVYHSHCRFSVGFSFKFTLPCALDTCVPQNCLDFKLYSSSKKSGSQIPRTGPSVPEE